MSTETYTYRCRACNQSFELWCPRHEFIDAKPVCPCGSRDCRRYEPTGLDAGQLTQLANADLKFGRSYPYVSNRLPLNMPGHPHNKIGKTVVMNAQAEREICARHELVRE